MESPANGTVLLVEDQALIALYVEELLNQTGIADVCICSSCSAASDWLRDHTPSLAIIETRVRDGACNDIATDLAKKAIPFIIHSGDRNWEWFDLSIESKCRWLDKPCDPDEFSRAIRDCCGIPY